MLVLCDDRILKGNRRECEVVVGVAVRSRSVGCSDTGGGGNFAYSLGGPVYAFSFGGSRVLPLRVSAGRDDEL